MTPKRQPHNATRPTGLLTMLRWPGRYAVLRLTTVVLAVSITAVGLPGTGVHAPGDANAQSQSDRDELRRKLDAARKARATDEARVSEIEKQNRALIADREELTGRLILLGKKEQDTERRLSLIEASLAAIDARLADLADRKREINIALSAQRKKIAGLLAALQRMGRNPPPVIVTRRDDALEMVRSAMLLEHAFPELRDEARKLRSQLEEKIAVENEEKQKRSEQVGQQAKEREEKQKLKREQKEVDDLLEQKRQLLAKNQSDLDTIRIEADKKASEIQSLGELIAALDKTIEQKTDLGRYNRDLKRAEREGREREIAALPTTPKATPPIEKPEVAPERRPPITVPDLDQPGATLVPGSGRLPLGTGRLTPAIPFGQARGKLPMPTSGRVVLAFGSETQTGRRSRGVVFQTRPSARITSPADGWIVYAGAFRSYGQLLIINAGDGYHIVMAGLSRIDVRLGQFVLASEPVGTMPSTPSTGAGNAATVLYVEFRKQGRPIDPKPWWAQGQVVAQR